MNEQRLAEAISNNFAQALAGTVAVYMFWLFSLPIWALLIYFPTSLVVGSFFDYRLKQHLPWMKKYEVS